MRRWENRNIVILTVMKCNEGIADNSTSIQYLTERISGWTERFFTEENKKKISHKKAEKELKKVIVDCNSYMYGSSCSKQVLSASLGIVVIIKNRYILLQAGNVTFCSFTKGHSDIFISGSDNVLGRHSDCEIIANTGKIGLGDMLVMCNVRCTSDSYRWYMKTLLKKRYRYTRRHGRGISCADINDCLIQASCDAGITDMVSSVICCERSAI